MPSWRRAPSKARPKRVKQRRAVGRRRWATRDTEACSRAMRKHADSRPIGRAPGCVRDGGQTEFRSSPPGEPWRHDGRHGGGRRALGRWERTGRGGAVGTGSGRERGHGAGGVSAYAAILAKGGLCTQVRTLRHWPLLFGVRCVTPARSGLLRQDRQDVATVQCLICRCHLVVTRIAACGAECEMSFVMRPHRTLRLVSSVPTHNEWLFANYYKYKLGEWGGPRPKPLLVLAIAVLGCDV